MDEQLIHQERTVPNRGFDNDSHSLFTNITLTALMKEGIR